MNAEELADEIFQVWANPKGNIGGLRTILAKCWKGEHGQSHSREDFLGIAHALLTDKNLQALYDKARGVVGVDKSDLAFVLDCSEHCLAKSAGNHPLELCPKFTMYDMPCSRYGDIFERVKKQLEEAAENEE